MDLVKELEWRGLLHDMIPGTQELLNKEQVSGYIGFDPTADSLHIGNLVPVMLLVHLQRAGHKPIALVGGATGMVGDPSGKSAERQLLDVEQIQKNLEGQEKQLRKFLSFEGENSAEVVNNYDWFKEIDFLEFIRDVGKHITVNYMMAKDSVKNRLEGGMSFTEFSYQLVQGYDFLHLFQHKNCKLQMGGSDQWGNITTGTELIRRKAGGEAYALTAPLLKKSDGQKFGKSEGGNVWLDPEKTSPYKFYQYWINVSDEDAPNLIKIFTLLDESTINDLVVRHQNEPHLRLLQKTLAEEVTKMVHSEVALKTAQAASSILFGKSTKDQLDAIDERTFLEVFAGVPKAELAKSEMEDGLDVIDALSGKTGFLKSNGEARRALKENSISVNKNKVQEGYTISKLDLINDKYVLLQRGKRNYFIVQVK
ncbi:MAG: tyrosine--tRNA ligase [Flavobacteriales bacterium]|nr:tyrosine--tRNA ligase [Flavobacteriales bacterium]